MRIAMQKLFTVLKTGCFLNDNIMILVWNIAGFGDVQPLLSNHLNFNAPVKRAAASTAGEALIRPRLIGMRVFPRRRDGGGDDVIERIEGNAGEMQSEKVLKEGRSAAHSIRTWSSTHTEWTRTQSACSGRHGWGILGEQVLPAVLWGLSCFKVLLLFGDHPDYLLQLTIITCIKIIN